MIDLFKQKILPIFTQYRKSTLVRDGLGSLIIKVAHNLINFLIGVLLVRLLGIDGYGTYSFVIAIIVFLYIPAEFGLPNLLIRETAKGLVEDEPDTVRNVWRWSVKFTGLLTAAVLLIAFVVLYLLFRNQRISQVVFYTFLVGLALVPFTAYIHLARGAMQGMNRIIAGFLPEQVILKLVFLIILGIYFVVPSLNLTPFSAMVVNLLVTIATFLLSMVLLFKYLPKREKLAISESKKWLNSSSKMALSSGMEIIKARTSTVLLGFLAGAFPVGIYQIALQGSMIASIILQSSNAAMAPRFSNLYYSKNIKKLQRLVTINSRIVFLINILMTVGFILFGRFFLRVFFGPDSVAAYLPLLIMLVGQMVNSLVGGVAFLLNMTGHEKQTMWSTGISLIFSLLLNLILIPSYGIVGSAIATSFSQVIAQFAMWRFVKKQLGINSLALYKAPPIVDG